MPPTAKKALNIGAKFSAELIGTAFLMAVGNLHNSEYGLAGTMGVTAIGLTYTIATYSFSDVSGSHFNPAVTMACGIWNLMPATDVAPYMIAQVAGAFIGNAVAQSLSPVPKFIPYENLFGVFVAEMFFTCMLVLVYLCSCQTPLNKPNYHYGLSMGLAVIAGANAIGTVSGGFMNPAVCLAVAGGGGAVAIAAECTGAILAAIVHIVVFPGELAGSDPDAVFKPTVKAKGKGKGKELAPVAGEAGAPAAPARAASKALPTAGTAPLAPVGALTDGAFKAMDADGDGYVSFEEFWQSQVDEGFVAPVRHKGQKLSLKDGVTSRRVSEFVGSFFLMLTYACCTMSGGVAAGWSVAATLTLMINCFINTSGGHFNPSVTVAMWIKKKVGMDEAWAYIVYQHIGMVLALFVAVVLYPEEELFLGPGAGYGLGASCMAEMCFTILLCFAVLNVFTVPSKTLGGIGGFTVGSVYTVATYSVGRISGCVLNPAITLSLYLAGPLTFSTDLSQMSLLQGSSHVHHAGHHAENALLSTEYMKPFSQTSPLDYMGTWFAYAGFQLLGCLLGFLLYYPIRFDVQMFQMYMFGKLDLNFELPDMPDLSMPTLDIDFPDIDFPDINVDLSMPEISAPTCSLPECRKRCPLCGFTDFFIKRCFAPVCPRPVFELWFQMQFPDMKLEVTDWDHKPQKTEIDWFTVADKDGSEYVTEEEWAKYVEDHKEWFAQKGWM